MTELRLVVGGIEMGESPRWHDGRLWFCDWMAHEVRAVDLDGRVEVIAARRRAAVLDRLAGRRDPRRRGRDRGAPPGARRHAHPPRRPVGAVPAPVERDRRRRRRPDLGRTTSATTSPAAASPEPGIVAVVTPDGEVRQVADDVLFPNGMAVTADGSTLIVAESHGHRLTAFDIGDDATLTNRRVWADLGAGAAPDGICIDADGAVWWAEVPGQRCVRTAEGGAVLRTVEADRGCFACMLGGPTAHPVRRGQRLGRRRGRRVGRRHLRDRRPGTRRGLAGVSLTPVPTCRRLSRRGGPTGRASAPRASGCRWPRPPSASAAGRGRCSSAWPPRCGAAPCRAG